MVPTGDDFSATWIAAKAVLSRLTAKLVKACAVAATSIGVALITSPFASTLGSPFASTFGSYRDFILPTTNPPPFALFKRLTNISSVALFAAINFTFSINLNYFF